MGYFRATDTSDRVKAIAAVAVVHVVLAGVILSGLNVRIIAEKIEALDTFDVIDMPTPPPEPPPPMRQADRARQDEGAAGKKADPTPVAAPKPVIVVPAPPPIAAAPVAGTGSAVRSGAATAGAGPGAGGSGAGTGGGGAGDFSGYTPARVIRRIPNSEYRRISGGRIPQGSATIAFRVSPDGRLSGCRITRSSGDPTVDGVVCQAASTHMRFSPARDRDGKPVWQDMTYTPTWSPYR
jgi:protein TonB